jgi:hypothetical protein
LPIAAALSPIICRPIPGISNGEAVHAIEHGRGDTPERFERELTEFAKEPFLAFRH